ncbi:hypothetical protein [Stratiformator vulcanicus]|uniref:Competence protein A n=1 Tax=Stratiformator vulcanicus TaxID=2527980 RepID=A0A517R238_9PLAN|nr:hypothetical protein [Stratiformator vulcanicus]QDT37949.1 Competence protein A [Stratiformator vulcanicus]
MVHPLGIEWHSNRLVCIDRDAEGGPIHVRHTFHAEVPSQEGEEAFVLLLSRELKERGMSPRDAVVTVPREDVVVRRLELPNVPDEDLYALVEMQLATVSAMPVDQIVFDYIPCGSSQDGESRYVLSAAITHTTLAAICVVLSKAGLTVQSIGVSTLDLLTGCLGKGVFNSATVPALLAWHRSGRFEAVAYDHSGPLLIHAAELWDPDEAPNDRLLSAELNRTFVLCQQSLHEQPIATVHLIGDFDEAVRGILTTHSDIALNFIAIEDLVDCESEDHERALNNLPAVLAGIETADKFNRFDFLHPRKPKPKPDRRRLYLASAAAGLLLMCVGLYAYVAVSSGDLQAEIDRLNLDISDVDAVLKRGEPTITSVETIDVWREDEVNWLFELSRLAERLPGTDRVYLLDLRINPVGGDALATIQGSGRAKNRRDVEETYQSLSDAGYRVRPKQIDLTRSDPDYPYRFEIDVQVLESDTGADEAVVPGEPATQSVTQS